MVRTQISLTEAQMARLRAEALRRDVPIAQIVREAVERELAGDEWERRRRAALEAVGCLAGGDSDVAERHDAYLADAFTPA